MEERRKTFRIRRPLLIKFKDTAGNYNTLCINNVNYEGVCFLSPIPFSEGEIINISLKLPSRPHEWHECTCKVLESKDITKYPGAFVSGFRTRVKFESISEQTLTFLKDYCAFAMKQNQALERLFQKQLGIWEKGKEKRVNTRINKSIVAMYGETNKPGPAQWDITVIRNISIGGAVFTTKTAYKNFAHLQLLMKVPLKPFDWIGFSGKVIESTQLHNLDDFIVGGTYLTRVEFFAIPMENRELLEEYVEWFVAYLKKLEDRGLFQWHSVQ